MTASLNFKPRTSRYDPSWINGVAGVATVGEGGDERLNVPNPSLERGRLRSLELEAMSNFATGVGDDTGEAGRLNGLKNEGVLMACIGRGIEECGVVFYCLRW